MKRWASWIRNAVTPTPSEISRAENILPESVLHFCREQTEPTEEEVQAVYNLRAVGTASFRHATEPSTSDVAALIRTLPTEVPGRNPIRTVGFGATGVTLLAMAAAFLFWVNQPGNTYGPLPMPLAQVHQTAPSEAYQFGPSIVMHADAQMTVVKADEQRTVIQVLDGSTHFAVEPDGDFRYLTVQAGDVEVVVKGTVFDVHRTGTQVEVFVERGLVEVRHDAVTYRIAKGETWRTPQELVEVASTEVIPEVLPSPAPEPVAVLQTNRTAKAPPVQRHSPAPSESKTVSTPATPPELIIQISGDTLDFHKIQDQKDAGLNPDQVVHLVDEFLNKWPNSPHIRQAAELRTQSVIAGSNKAEAVNALSQLLTHGKIQGRLNNASETRYRTLRATLLRDSLNDCQRAIEDYRYLVSHTRGKAQAASYAWLGLCASNLGQMEEARGAFQHIDLQLLGADLRKIVTERQSRLND